MRIGIDARTLSYEYTGIPIYVHDTIKYWNEKYTDHEFFLFSNRDFQLDFSLKRNWHIVIDKHRFGTLWVHHRLHKLLKEYEVDVFWEPMNFLPKRISGIRYIVTVHDLAVFLHPEFGAITDVITERLLLKKSCRSADRIIAISQATKNDIKKYLGVRDEKISVIYNGDSPYTGKTPSYKNIEQDEVLDRWNLKEKEFFLFVGTIEPRKNIETIVKAFEKFKEKTSYLKKLVLVGKSGWKNSKIYNLIENSKFSKDIVLTGYVTEMEKECLYRNASALVFPSFHEGFGFPIVEAMSVGIPVITSRISSMPEVGGDAAIYLDESQISDADALERVMEDVSGFSQIKIDEICKQSFEQASKFSRKNGAEKIFEIITMKGGEIYGKNSNR